MPGSRFRGCISREIRSGHVENAGFRGIPLAGAAANQPFAVDHAAAAGLSLRPWAVAKESNEAWVKPRLDSLPAQFPGSSGSMHPP